MFNHKTRCYVRGAASRREWKCLSGTGAFVPLTALFVHLEMSTWPPQDAAIAKSFNTMLLPHFLADLAGRRCSGVSCYLWSPSHSKSWRSLFCPPLPQNPDHGVGGPPPLGEVWRR